MERAEHTYIYYEKWEPYGGKRIAYNTSIVGMRYRQSAANAAFRWGKTPDFRFYAEPDNPYDGNAVAVIADGKHIGYLPEEVAEKVAKKQYPLDQIVFELRTLRRTEGDVSGLYGNLWLLSEPATQPQPEKEPEPQSDTLPLPDELSTIPTAVKLPSINPQTGAVIAFIVAVLLPIIGGAAIGFAGIVIGLLVGLAIIIAAALRVLAEDKQQ